MMVTIDGYGSGDAAAAAPDDDDYDENKLAMVQWIDGSLFLRSF